MWVFGYGSLIWDEWPAECGCLRYVAAELPGFTRTFNKGSVKNWGSPDNPCPTLNLAPDPSKICKGVAFEFPDDMQKAVVDYLKVREGKGFSLRHAEIRLESGERVFAMVPIYSGRNLLIGRSLTELVEMARKAQGAHGRCFDYARNIATKLADLGISDPGVDEFWRALE
jgi:cation transport regulator ChaC